MADADQKKPARPAAQQAVSAWLRRSRTIRDAPSYAEGLVFGAACVGLMLLVWWMLTRGEGDARIVDAYTLPSPGDTFASFRSLWF